MERKTTLMLVLLLVVVLVTSYQLSIRYCPTSPSSSSVEWIREQQLRWYNSLSASASSSLAAGGGDVERDALSGRMDSGADDATDEEDDDEDSELSDDITFLFAIINMNRKAHLGIENYTFEGDYLQQVKGFMRSFRPEKMQVIIQRKYYDYIKEELTPNIHVRFVEIEDLLNWQYYEAQERIRTSDWWVRNTPWLQNVPQGYSNLYNPIVSHKLLWLRDLSILNPFKTRYFVWLDSGGICTPRLNPNAGMHLDEFKPKVKYYMDKFFITVTSYALGNELHGCYRRAMLKLTHDQSPCYITKGWLMGGQKKYLVKVANLYQYVINKSLELGCLGTEETLLTMCYYRRPDLFHVHHSIERLHMPFGDGGDVCHVLWPGAPPQERTELPTEKAMREEQEERELGELG